MEDSFPAFYFSSCSALCRASTSCVLRQVKTWMAGTSQDKPGHDDDYWVLLLRRRRPRLLRAAQAFEGLGHCQHAAVVEAAADDLHADRETRRVISAIDRDGRILRHVPGHGVSDMLERLVGIVDRR